MLLGIGEVYWLRFDQFIHLVVIRLTSVEWGEAYNHFVGQDTKSPPIDWEGVTFLVKNFWSQIFWGTAERVRLFVLLKDLCQSEIGQTNETIFFHKDVLRLQISIDNFLLVKMAESQSNCKRIELSSRFRELPGFSQMHEKLTTSDKLHDEEDFKVCLEHELHTNEERMIGLLQDIFLKHSRLNLVIIQNDIFPE
jgi:hypothetical protein